MIGTHIIDKIDEMLPDDKIIEKMDDLMHTTKHTTNQIQNSGK